ncbi:MAG: hypothetical protein KDK34_11275 [Leptospiraceae bacterium]|nr:hypothetical protein [Leptospiraceae bacterium]
MLLSGNAQPSSKPAESFHEELLTEGDIFYDRALQAIRSARRYILLDMYIFQGDSIGRIIQQALIERARAGVYVRVVYDHFGSLETPNRFWNELRAAGASVFAYKPIFKFAPFRRAVIRRLKSPGWLQTFLRWVRLVFIRRDHRKILVVDGRVAFTGGFNIMRECSRREYGEARWLDTMYVTEIPMLCRALEGLFWDTWRRVHAPHVEYGELAHKRVREAIVLPANLKKKWERRPDIAGRMSIPRAVKKSIRRSTDRIYLMYPYFIPYGGLLRLLRDRARAGVQVSVFLSLRTDHRSLNMIAYYIAYRLSKDGVRVHLYHGRRVRGAPNRFAHAKLALFDRTVAVGSSNFDHRSLALNLETLVLRTDPVVSSQAEKFFEELKQYSYAYRHNPLQGFWLARLLYWFRRFL